MRADGTRHTYGRSANARVYDASTGRPRIAVWYLDEATDAFGNQIRYEYKPDLAVDAVHAINQTYLKAVYYVEYGADPSSPGGRRWLYRALFDYGERLRRGPQDAPRDIQVPLAPSGSRRLIPFAATVLRSLALLR